MYVVNFKASSKNLKKAYLIEVKINRILENNQIESR